MENLQSAEKAYQQLADLQKQHEELTKQYTGIQEKMKELESGSELQRLKNENEEIRKMYNDISEKFISQSETLNKLIISHGIPVDEKPALSQEEVELNNDVNAIQAKIEAQIKEQTTNNKGE